MSGAERGAGSRRSMAQATQALAADEPRHPRVAGAIIAFTWGFAEATFFFIVPDVFLTRVALTDLRRALQLSCAALAGALVGGSALWWVANHAGAAGLFHYFLWLPGVSNQLIWRVGQEISHGGAAALFVGALKGQPFKLFVVSASLLHMPIGRFLAYAALARLGRFWTTSFIASGCGKLLRGTAVNVRQQVHVLVWITFYAVYFAVMR